MNNEKKNRESSGEKKKKALVLLLIFGSLTAIVLFLFLGNRLLKEKDEKSTDINVGNVTTEGRRSIDVDLTFTSEEEKVVRQENPAHKVSNYFNEYYLGVETPLCSVDPDFMLLDD